MDQYFYKDWMCTGEDEYRYALTYPEIPFKTIEPLPQVPQLLQLSPGVFCSHANRYRNGNCFQELPNPLLDTVKTVQLSNISVVALYGAPGMLIVRNEWTLHFFDPVTLQLLHEEPWPPDASGLYFDGQKCIGINSELYEFSPNGLRIRVTRIPYASELTFLEAATCADNLVMSGYQQEALLPIGQYPFGFLFAVPPDGITEPRDKGQPNKITKSIMASYFNRFNSFPIYLDDVIIQPMRDRISFFNYDMTVSKVLTDEFDHCLISAGSPDIIYALTEREHEHNLSVFDTKGSLIKKNILSPVIGAPLYPPIIGTDGSVFCVGQQGLEVFDFTGEAHWTQVFPVDADSRISALCYSQTLSLCYGNRIMFLSGSGEVIFSHFDLEQSFTTPVVKIGDNRYVVGTESGLVAMEF